MNERLQELKCGGRPMTKLELLQKENERLNNIINELESHLEQQWLEWKDDSNDEIVAMANEDKCILEKLQELKGE